MRKGSKSEVDDDICDYSTDDNDSLEGEPLACGRCCYKTQKKWLMDRHAANHAKDKPFRCPSCRFTDRDASVFVNHLVKHSPKTKFIQCCFCSFKAMPSMMKSHILRHGPTERLDCSECEYWTSSVKSMTEHIEAYHTKKHQCPMCPKMLTKYALMKHVKKIHRSRKPRSIVSVDRWKKAAASRPGLTIIPVTKRIKPQLDKKSIARSKPSLPSMMPVVQLERCRVPPECWKSLESTRKQVGTRSGVRKSLEQVPEHFEPGNGSDYDADETSHDMQAAAASVEIPKGKQIRKPIYFPNLVAEFGDTLLTCSICDYQTRKEYLLERHSAKHKGDLPFVCRKCDFKNISVYEFANHMITHEGSVKDDVYSCCFCNFWTHKKHNIPIHLDRHRGANREFDCPECEEVLTSKTGLQTHFDKLHCTALDCQFCGKNMTKFELNLHIKEHAAEVQGSDRAADSDEQPDIPKPVVAESPARPKNPFRNPKYKPKPLSRKRLDTKSVPEPKKPKKVEVQTSVAVTSKYKPKPLSKKKPDADSKATTSKTLPPPSVIGRNVTEKPVTAGSKYQPRPLSKKIAAKENKDETSVKTEEESSTPKKRKLDATPTKDSPVKGAEGKELECRYCDYKTQIGSLMDRHNEKHKLDTPFKCTKCKYETLSSQKLSWHFMYHFPSQNEFPCPYCTFNSKNRMALPMHIERHRSVRFFDCSKCQFSGNSPHSVRKHFERMHVDKYSCTICDKVMTKHAMMKHLKKRHPSMYNVPISSSATEVQSYVKHYTKYMKPVSVAVDTQSGKESKLSTDKSEARKDKRRHPDIREDSGVKAAQQALAKEIFGEVSDSDDGAQKPSTNVDPNPNKNAAKPIGTPMSKSDDSDDSDSDSETVVPKLSCPKCDFTTNQITEVKSHYCEMHEIEYTCKLCQPSVTSTKHELLSHVKKNHPAVGQEEYVNVMMCRAPEKLQKKEQLRMESDDSNDSDDEATATVSAAPSALPADPVPEKLIESNLVAPPKEQKLVSEEEPLSSSINLTEEPLSTATMDVEQPEPMDIEQPVPMEIEQPAVIEQPSDSSHVPASDTVLLGTDESGRAVESTGQDDKMELELAGKSKEFHIPPAESEQIASQPEGIAECSTSATVNAVKSLPVVGPLVENPPLSKSRLQCNGCNFQTSRLSLLQRHSVKHKAGAPLVCPQCHFQNNGPYEFLLHWTKHFPDQIAFRCCFCAFATVSKLDLALHFCVHNNTRVFDCNECDYSTSTKAFFEGHIWSIHKKVTCQKCQESMTKTELPSHKCVIVQDDDVLNFSNEAAGVSSRADKVHRPTTEPSDEKYEKSASSVHSSDHVYVKTVEPSSVGKQIIARESFKTSELKKFSFLRKRDDIPSADVVFTSSSRIVEQPQEGIGEEPSPPYESLSADSSFAEDESGNIDSLKTVNDSSEVGEPNGTGNRRTDRDEEPSRESEVADADEVVVTKIGESHCQKLSPENSMEAERSEEAPSVDLVNEGKSNTGGEVVDRSEPIFCEEPNSAEPSNVEKLLQKKASSSATSRSSDFGGEVASTSVVTEEQRELPENTECPGTADAIDNLPPLEESFSAGSLSGVPVIDISGKPVPNEVAAPHSKPHVTSWTEPIESDDDDDHNYFISPRRSKSPAADLSPPSQQPRSSPVKPEDFSGDFVTEVVFDNGMTALVLEVTDSSEEEL